MTDVFEATVTLTARVPLEQLDSWIDMAGYGIRGWALGAVVDPDAETYTVRWATDVDQDPSEDNPLLERELAYGDLVRAACRLVTEDVEGYADTEQLGLLRASLLDPDDDQVDSELADAIVQLAVFGEVPFG